MGGKANIGRKLGRKSQGRKLRFPDKNLQLALLDEVQNEYYWLQEEEAKYKAARGSHPTWPTWDAIRSNEDTANLALEQYLLTLGLSANQLGEIENLSLDGDREIYGWIHAFWWDHGDHFVIHNLSGIKHCKKLKTLSLGQGVIEGCSLKPLVNLRELRTLSLCARGNHQDLDALLKVPNLQRLDIANVSSSDQEAEWEQVIDRLLAKGLPSLTR